MAKNKVIIPIRLAISDEVDTEGADKLKEADWKEIEDNSASDVDETKKRLGTGGADQ